MCGRCRLAPRQGCIGDVAATPDSVFQIGSITNVWTTTLIMGLPDEGRLDLDASVQTYLPGLRVADEAASAKITVRQLLPHECVRR